LRFVAARRISSSGTYDGVLGKLSRLKIMCLWAVRSCGILVSRINHLHAPRMSGYWAGCGHTAPRSAESLSITRKFLVSIVLSPYPDEPRSKPVRSAAYANPEELFYKLLSGCQRTHGWSVSRPFERHTTSWSRQFSCLKCEIRLNGLHLR